MTADNDALAALVRDAQEMGFYDPPSRAAQEFARRCANNRVAGAGRQWQEFLALVGREPPRVPVLTDADVDRVARRVVEMLDARDMDDHR